jgi:hypothetical protein
MMFETHLMLVGLWTVAGFAYVLHRYGMERPANAMMFGVVLGLSGLAEWNHHRPTPAIASLQPPASSVQASASTLQPLGSSLQARKFVASRNGSVYHLPTCEHYVPHMVGKIWYASVAEAVADHKQPCKECLGRLVAFSPQPFHEHPADESKDEQDAADDSGGEHSAALP